MTGRNGSADVREKISQMMADCRRSQQRRRPARHVFNSRAALNKRRANLDGRRRRRGMVLYTNRALNAGRGAWRCNDTGRRRNTFITTSKRSAVRERRRHGVMSQCRCHNVRRLGRSPTG